MGAGEKRYCARGPNQWLCSAALVAVQCRTGVDGGAPTNALDFCKSGENTACVCSTSPAVVRRNAKGRTGVLRLDAAGPVTAQEVRTRAGGIDCLLSLGMSFRPLRVPRRSQLTTFWLERVWQDCRESACYRLHLVRHGVEQPPLTERTQIGPLFAHTLSFVPRLMTRQPAQPPSAERASVRPVPRRLTFMCFASTLILCAAFQTIQAR